MGAAEIDCRVLDAIGKKGNELKGDAWEKSGSPYGHTYSGGYTVGRLLCSGTAVTKRRAGGIDRTYYGTKGE